MLRAFSAIANDGEMLEPKFISKDLRRQAWNCSNHKERLVGNPVPASVAQQTRNYMDYGRLILNLVPYSSDGPIIQVAGQNVAVKSGTPDS